MKQAYRIAGQQDRTKFCLRENHLWKNRDDHKQLKDVQIQRMGKNEMQWNEQETQKVLKRQEIQTVKFKTNKQYVYSISNKVHNFL